MGFGKFATRAASRTLIFEELIDFSDNAEVFVAMSTYRASNVYQ